MKKWLFLLLGIIVFALVWQTSQRKRGNLKFVDQNGSGNESNGITAPGFEEGGAWINSEPLVLEELLGGGDDKPKAILVDFWTYSCINCQRTIPYLQDWWNKYKDKGLLIIGVHSPEFEFEKDTDNVKAAIEKYGVLWPVVQDNEMKIWKAYKNNYWPRKYLINTDGTIVYDHIGEGAYEKTERRIQEALGLSGIEVTKEPQSGGVGFGMKQTPEVYVNNRGKSSGQIGKGMNKVELIGEWKIEEEFSSAGKGAKLRLEFQAAEMNLVMSSADENKDLSVRFSIDGGEEKELVINQDDLYNLLTGEFGKYTLEMSVDEGVRVHAFTFGK